MKRKQKQFPIGYSMSRAILDILLDSGENLPLFQSPYTRMKRSWRKLEGMPEPKRWRYNRAMRYLEHREQIQILKKNDDLFIKLTEKGKLTVLMSHIRTDFDKHKQWDGKWRLIIWDIPESSSKQRDKIRYFFKQLGFYKLQLSVFVTPHPLPGAAVRYLKISGLFAFLRFLRVDKIDDDTELKKHFQIV